MTPSRKSAGAVRGLIHGSKGVAGQAEFFKVEKNRSFLGTLLVFAGKCLLAVVAVGAVVALAAVLISAIGSGIAAGLAEVTEALSTASSYLVIGAIVAVTAAFVAVGFKIARSMTRARAHASERAAHRTAAVQTAVEHPRSPQVSTGQPTNRASQEAQVAHVQTAAADWYPDPSSPSQIRYWNGSGWTHHVRHTPSVATTPAGWYQAPSDPTQLRYWNGTAWSDHFAPGAGTALAARPATPQSPETDPAQIGADTRIQMSSAEWQNAVRTWMAAGAIEQELWRRLSNAQINDADPLTLEAQHRMEQLSAEQAAQGVRLMLDANPRLRDELATSEFLTFFLRKLSSLDARTPASIDRAHEQGT